jgi:hypothetical protein
MNDDNEMKITNSADAWKAASQRYCMTEQSKESLYNYLVYGLPLVLPLQWLVRYAPSGSYGSPEAVRGWLNNTEYFRQYQKELVAERLAQPE